MIQKCHHLLQEKNSRKTVLWSDTSKFEILFGNYGGCILCTKDEREHPACYQRSVQKPTSLMVWAALVPMTWAACTFAKGTISAERHIQILLQHMLPSRQCLFQRPCIFQQDNATATATAWFRSRKVRMLNWQACNMDLSPTENIWCIMKQKIWQRRPRAVEQLESNMRKKWDNIPFPKFQQLVSSVARRLRGVAGRREDATQGKTWLSPNVLKTCRRHQIQDDFIS